jgi:chromosome segregation ATPase
MRKKAEPKGKGEPPKDKVKELEKKRRALLRRYRSTERDLKAQKELLRRLKSAGVDPSDVKKMAVMTSSAAEAGFSPKAFAKRLKEEGSLQGRLRVLKGEVKEREERMKELETIEERIPPRRKELSDLQSACDELDGKLKKHLALLEEARGNVSRLEELLNEDAIFVKLFKEAGGLTAEEVDTVIRQLKEWAAKAPTEVGRLEVREQIGLMSTNGGA